MSYVEFGYLELNYLETYDYLVAVAEEKVGFQARFVIDTTKHVGEQARITIDTNKHVGQQAYLTVETTSHYGFQSRFVFDATKNVGFQSRVTIDDDQHVGFQERTTINDDAHVGQQSLFGINDDQHVGFQTAITVDTDRNLGHQAALTKHRWRPCDYYLAEEDYLTEQYLVYCHEYLISQQANIINSKDKHVGFQTQIHIDATKHVSFQARYIITQSNEYGHQAQIITTKRVGFQTRIIIYNIDNLRVLCDFASRGSETTGGTNAWGNPVGAGQSWQASSTQPGDYSEDNLNTDIVEQIWRSATGVTTVNLDCDTERAQGIGLDTMGILNHNLTTTAAVTLIGSTSSTFSPAGTVIPLEVTTENMYYIAPTLPLSQFRYWRIQISDPTNTSNYLSIGTIVFGDSIIFNDANFKNPISFRKQHFSDGVFTEGFTNVFNDRGIKKLLKLDFQDIRITSGNYSNLSEIFDHDRTNLKCLYIPTPRHPGRYAVFSKLVTLPEESHNDVGPDADYVSLSIELDESR